VSERKERPTLVGGRLVNVSATQIQLFKRCPLAWYYKKVEKRPGKPVGKGALLGGECHKRREHYLLTGEDVQGEIERAGNPLLQPWLWAAPFNGGPGIVEGEVTGLKTADGVDVGGYYDFAVPEFEFRSWVFDWKFKKSIVKWGATVEELAGDEQAIIYGAFAVLAWGTAKVNFAHHTHQTQGPRLAVSTGVRFNRDEVLDKFAVLAGFVDSDMAAIAKLPEGVANDVPFKTSGCSAFGGCDYAAVCPRSPMNASGGIFGLTETNVFRSGETHTQQGGNMGLMDQLRGGSAAKLVDQKAAAYAATPSATEGDLQSPAAATIKAEVEAAAKKVSTEPLKETKAKLKKEAPATGEGFELLVDCSSSKSTDLTADVINTAKELAKLYKVADIRVAPKESDLAYGGWKAVLAATYAKKTLSGKLSIYTTELTAPVIEVLTSLASDVVRG